ncbi:ABC transporter permease subunit [Saccharothrix sp. AJ9571]|nr:ABC transporter permease subunit [Saccharothrix sp. AJ9571]
MIDFADELAAGLRSTVELVALSWAGAAVLALVLVSCRVSTVAPARQAAKAVIHTVQSVPLLLWLLLAAFALPSLGLDVSLWARAAGTLACYTAVYYAEALRSGINAVGRGQTDAARALGFTSSQTLVQVVLPQGLRHALPVLGTLTIGLLLNTSLVGAVGVLDLTAVAQQIAYITADPVAAFGTTSCIYAAVGVVITVISRKYAQRLAKRFPATSSGPGVSGAVRFDEPGPRGRHRIRAASVVVLAGLVLVLVLGWRALYDAGELDPTRWAAYREWPIWRFLLEGAAGTAVAGVLGIGVAALPGTVLGLLAAHHRLTVRRTASAVADAVLVVPLLLWLYATMLVLPAVGIRLPQIGQLVLPLAITAAAGIAKILATSIHAIDPGQRDGALALGLPEGAALRLVVLPQAVRHALPALIGQLTRTIKDTSLGLLIAFPELLGQTRVLSGHTFLVLQPYLVTAALYAVITGSLTLLAHTLERRSRRETARTSTRTDAAPDRTLAAQLT